ncbi:MAG: polysaccharide biosynthesis C-terminal domain-containing protein [Verrucomicrobiota bacterium]|nr:polysaccharide biosynthesis C-terminal domain-containing protein [Verrucomicrobiota bacterium]
MGNRLEGKTVLWLTAEAHLLRFFVLAASFAANIFIARLLGLAGKGVLATVSFWAGLVGSILSFGLESTGVFYVGEAQSRFHRLARFMFLWALGASALGVAGLFGISSFVECLRGQSVLVLVCAGLVLTNLLTGLFNALHIGAGRLSLVNRVSVVGGALYLTVACLLFMMRRADVLWMLLGILGGNTLTSLYLVARAARAPRAREAQPLRWREFFGYAAKVYAGSISVIAYANSNFMILSLLSSAAEAGVYSVATLFADTLLILPSTLSSIMIPRLAGMVRDQAVRQVSMLTRYAAACGLLMSAGVVGAATLLIPLAFGKALEPAVRVCWILCGSTWIAAAGMVVSIYFYGTRRPGIPSAASWLGFLLVAAFTVALVPQFGGYGAAWALLLSRAAVTVYLLIRYVRDSRERLGSALFMTRHDCLRGYGLLKSLWSTQPTESL